MSYYFAKPIAGDFGNVVERTIAALKNEGFGIITEIDVRDTFAKKLGIEFRNKVGTMLPCNVVVQERPGGVVEVAAIDAVASMQAIDNPRLKEAAKTVRDKLEKVVESI
jgi:uncharacterized protein (DUF302 family)